MPQFRAKARAVDLLGKGQIADLPTAISELWKNGYDAYGDNMEAFIYTKSDTYYQDPVFVISDDGKGMSRDEILSKWFILGTDSKSRNEEDVLGEETLWKKPRTKMGEKGIGRLAVAYLGPQMLMLTKREKFPLEAIFFDWRIMQNYDLFLTDINIPLRKVENESLPTFFQELKDEFVLNFPEAKIKSEDPWKDQQELKKEIVEECRGLALPDYIIQDCLASFLVEPERTHGTKFVIFQPIEQIIDLQIIRNYDEEKERRDEISVNHTISALAGLFNLFKSESLPYKATIKAVNDAGPYNLFSHRQFFVPKDFEECDHLIKGSFDEYGTFTGQIRIYNKTIEHSFSPIKRRKLTHYGPFGIQLGYVNPKNDQSIIPEREKEVFEQKLEFFSGLFIYRDGIRVLPYGRPDTDFLEFEERRSRSAGDYFFTKRRMFGYLEISRIGNNKLIDKSSREGFINNAAYRDFRVDLIAFFRDLAKKYFATKAEFDYKKVQQEELKRLSLAAQQEHQREIEERKKFAQQLSVLPQDLASLERNFLNSVNSLKAGLEKRDVSYEELRPLLDGIENEKIKISNFKISRPVRYQPTELQEKKFRAYQRQFEDVSKEISGAAALLDQARSRLQGLELFREYEARAELYNNTLSSQFAQFEDRLEAIFKKIREQLVFEKNSSLSEFADKAKALEPAKDRVDEVLRSMRTLETVFQEAKERMTERIAPYLNHLDRLSFDVNEDDLVGYYKDQFKVMQEEWEQTNELAQLGIAVEIIDHEFNALYSQLAENINSFNVVLQPGNESRRRYLALLTSFHHLENNYKLLQPLYRTAGRIRKEITGRELYQYAMDFFRDRLERNDITFYLSATAAAWTVFSYESIFKSVLINIINNAVYWLQPANHRIIELDATEEGSLLIMNSGVKIDDPALIDIFKLFYSERPNGRGIGLYLAKKSLNGIGFDISATNDPRLNRLDGACFTINPLKPT